MSSVLSRPLPVLLLLFPETMCDIWRTSSQVPSECELPVLGSELDWTAVNWSQPFVVHNVSNGWSASQAWRDQRNFLRQHGALQQHARWGIGSRQFGTVSRPTSVRDYIRTMHADNSTGLLFGDATGNLRPAGGYWELPQFIKDAGLVHPMISIGPADEGLAFHNHGATFECVVIGQKVILLFEPLGAESDANNANWAAAHYLTPTSVWMERYAIDPRAHQLPQLPNDGQSVALRKCLLKEGHAVYIPCNWWHATRNLGDAVAVGATGDVESTRCAADRFAESELTATSVALEQANGNLEKAEALLRKACRLAPYNIACATSLGHMLSEMHRPSEAEDVLASAAARIIEAHQAGWLPAEPLSAGLLKLAEQLLSLGRRSAKRAGAVMAEAARADPHNAKAQVQHLFLRIGQSKSLSEMRHLIDEALAIAEGLSVAVDSAARGGEAVGSAKWLEKDNVDEPLRVGSRFYQVADQGVTLSDCSTKHDLMTVQELSDQVHSGIAVVRKRLASLEASELTEAQNGLHWDCSMLALGTLLVFLALPQ